MRLLTRMKLHIVLSKFAKILPFDTLKYKCILLIIRSVFPSAEKKGSSHSRPSAIWNGESTKEARENRRVRGTHTRKRFVLLLTVDRKTSSSARTSRRSEFFRLRSKQKKKKNNSTSPGLLRLWRFSNMLLGEITSSSNQVSSRVYKCSSIVLKIWF